MEFSERVTRAKERYDAAMLAKHGELMVVSAADLPDFNYGVEPQDGDTWGGGAWRFDAHHLTLDYIRHPHGLLGREYCVSLSDLTSAERFVDWVGHLLAKGWDVGGFVQALWDLTHGGYTAGGAGEWHRTFSFYDAVERRHRRYRAV